MSSAKVTLSSKELELVTDGTWILTKNEIIQKVYTLFGELSVAYAGAIGNSRLAGEKEILQRSPKISKGEQYEGLPWVMLDQPRYYSGADAVGIRTFFWWGNSVSITMQLSGEYREKYIDAIREHFEKQPVSGWWICTGETAWQHHFRQDNYQPFTIPLLNGTQTFIKLAKQFPLHDWDHLQNRLLETFQEMVAVLSAVV